MAIDYKKTGRAISACRQELGLSQQELAQLMNVTHQAVSKWENGAALPDTAILLALSKLFDVTMEALLLGEVEPKALAAQRNNGNEPDEAPQPEQKAEKAGEHVHTHALEAMAESIEAQIEDGMKAAFEAQPGWDAAFEGFDVMEKEDADDVPKGGIDKKLFARITGMLPFVSTEMADELFARAAADGTASLSQLVQVAPFVSRQVLSDCVMKLAEKGLSREDTRRALSTLAPFLDQKTLESLVNGELGDIDSKLAMTLMPFVNTKTADALVRRMMGAQMQSRADAAAEKPEHRETTPDKRAEIRWRIALKAAESGNTDWIEEHADELTEVQQEQLGAMAIENGDEALLEALLSTVRDDVINHLLEKAMEAENWELINLISENM